MCSKSYFTSFKRALNSIMIFFALLLLILVFNLFVFSLTGFEGERRHTDRVLGAVNFGDSL